MRVCLLSIPMLNIVAQGRESRCAGKAEHLLGSDLHCCSVLPLDLCVLRFTDLSVSCMTLPVSYDSDIRMAVRVRHISYLLPVFFLVYNSFLSWGAFLAGSLLHH